ncbi:MAG: GntP family permease, partial [Bacteroidota bacterium]
MTIFIWLLLVVALIVWLTARWKLHPFLALLFGAIGMGFLAQMETVQLIESIGDGFGSTLRSIGIVIAAGAIIGEYLDRSGGAKVLANHILEKVGEKNSPLSMSLTGYIVSIPVFCDSGFIVLSSLNKAIAKRTKISLTVLAVALASGLYATHVFVPPTPGPLAAAATLGADIG